MIDIWLAENIKSKKVKVCKFTHFVAVSFYPCFEQVKKMALLDFACSDCDQSFNMRIKLKKHKKSHIKRETRDFLSFGEKWTDEEKVMI